MRKAIVPVLLMVFALSACGYAIKKTHSIDSVRLGLFENMTFEPQLQDRFMEALSRELVENGIRIASSDTAHRIHGTLNTLKLRSTAEQEGVTVEYEVTIEGNFYLTAPDGKTRELRGSGKFIVDFSGKGDLEKVIARKERAILKALRNITEEIVYSVVHGQ